MSIIKIFDIKWSRAILELYYESESDDRLYLYRVKEQRFVPFESETAGDYKIARLNVVITEKREPLTKGRWIICRKIDDSLLSDFDTLLTAKPYLKMRMERDVRRFYKQAENDESFLDEFIRNEGLSYIAKNPYDTHEIVFADAILENIENYSRFFQYVKGKYGYYLWLSVRKNSEGLLSVDLNTDFYIRNSSPRKRKKSKRYAEKQIFRICFNVISFFVKRKGNRILFFKQNGDEPTENMLVLQNRMIERGIDKEFKITYRYRNVFKGKQRVIKWLKDLIVIAENDYIFIDDYTPIFNFIDVAEDVVLTQIWHAGVGFKSVGYARFGLKGSPDPYDSSHRKYTYALIGNKHLRDIYSEVFGIEPEALLATGMPRLEHFMDEETVQNARDDLYNRYPELKNGRVILFAPTFRGTGQKTAYYPYSFIDMQQLHDMCEDTNSYFIFEMHHFIIRKPPIDEDFNDRIWDLSCENLNELFHVSDLLITDYSSCFYDYLLTEKPVVLYVPDKLEYIATRGVQRSVDDMAPGQVCESFGDLMDTLYTKKYETVKPKALIVDRAHEKGMLASDRAIDFILYKKDVPGVRFGAEDAASKEEISK